MLDGATLFRVRGFSLYPAEERARVISDRIWEAARTWTIAPEEVRAVPVEDAVDIVAGDQVLMVVTEADARFVGVVRGALAQATVDRIQRGLRAYRQARDPGVLLGAAWRSLLATALLIAALVGLAWAFRRLEAGFNRRYARKVPSVQIQSLEIMRAHRVRAVFRATLRALRASVAAVLVYSWLQYVLGSFPGTRPLAARLLTLLLDPLSRIGAGLLSLIPDLAFLLVLYVLTRGLLRFARLYFDAVGRRARRALRIRPGVGPPDLPDRADARGRLRPGGGLPLHPGVELGVLPEPLDLLRGGVLDRLVLVRRERHRRVRDDLPPGLPARRLDPGRGGVRRRDARSASRSRTCGRSGTRRS